MSTLLGGGSPMTKRRHPQYIGLLGSSENTRLGGWLSKVLWGSPGPLKITEQERPRPETDTEVAGNHVEQKHGLQILVLLTALRRAFLPLT